MSSRPLALVVFAAALVASVATSRPTWSVEDFAEGPVVALGPTAEEASFHLDYAATGIPEDGEGVLTVELRVVALDVPVGAPVLDLVLVAEEAEGDRVVEDWQEWTIALGESGNDLNEGWVALNAFELAPTGTYRLDVTHLSGSPIEAEPRAQVRFTWYEEVDLRRAAVTLALTP